MACFNPFKVTFRAYKQAWNVRNGRSKVKKDNLDSWIFLVFKKALINTNIRTRFRKAWIWPLNMKAMKTKMDPSEGILPQCC